MFETIQWPNEKIQRILFIHYCYYFFVFRPLNQHHLPGLVVRVPAHAHQEFLEFQESQDQPDQLVLQEQLATKDLKDRRAWQDIPVTRATQGLKDLKAPRVLQGSWDVTGNNVYLRIWTKERTVDW